MSLNSLAGVDGINPNKLKQKPFYLYKNLTVDKNKNIVDVDGFKYERSGNTIYITPEGNKSKLTLEQFLFYRRLGSSSFPATTGSGGGRGSAFLVADDLVLTNKHVADTDNTKKACGSFSVDLSVKPKKTVSCKKVWYCDSHDFCLIEMNKTKEGHSLSYYTKPLSISSRLAASDSTIFLIGNSYDLGVQGSEGKTFKYVNKIKEFGAEIAAKHFSDSIYELNFYAPSLGGSSGSPIFDNKGNVVGINFAHSSATGSSLGNDVTNHAVPAYYILQQLKKVLPKEVYAKISIDKNNLFGQDQFVSEWIEAQDAGKADYTLDFKEFASCILDQNSKSCEEQIENEFSRTSLAKKFQNLNQVELSAINLPEDIYGMSFKELEVLRKKQYLDYFDAEDSRKACASKKNFTDDCIAKDYAKKAINKLTATSKILKKYEGENFSEIYESFAKDLKVNQSSSYFLFANTLEKDPQAVGKAFFACLKGVEKLYIVDGTYDAYSTPIYTDGCELEMVKSLKNDGYELNAADESELLLALKGDKKLSQMIDSFQRDVIKEWKIFINQPFAKKAARKDHNQELISKWLNKNELSLEADKITTEISSKFKLFFM
jgi:S1-C subfamily serine protease